MNKVALALLLWGLTVACGSQIATNMKSEPLEYYNDGCQGYLFESSVQRESAILSRTLTDGTDAGSLVFRAMGAGEYRFDGASSSPELVVDNDPPAIATLKGERICFHFTLEDETSDACLASLIKTGAICTKLKAEQPGQ